MVQIWQKWDRGEKQKDTSSQTTEASCYLYVAGYTTKIFWIILKQLKFFADGSVSKDKKP